MNSPELAQIGQMPKVSWVAARPLMTVSRNTCTARTMAIVAAGAIQTAVTSLLNTVSVSVTGTDFQNNTVRSLRSSYSAPSSTNTKTMK